MSQETRGSKLRASLKGGRRKVAYRKSRALVIGVDDYGGHHRPLKNAGNDAHEFAKLLRFYGFECTELFDKQATKSGILGYLRDTLPSQIGLHEDDAVVIFFSGHGMSQDGKRGYIVPYGAGQLFADYISMGELREVCDTLKARHVLIILDCCFSGMAASRSAHANVPPLSKPDEAYVNRLLSRPSWQLLMAGEADEPVADSGRNRNHSAFTYHLLQGLSGAADRHGEGIITARELEQHVYTNVHAETKGTVNVQIPFMNYLNADAQRGDFVFQVPSNMPHPWVDDIEPPPLHSPTWQDYLVNLPTHYKLGGIAAIMFTLLLIGLLLNPSAEPVAATPATNVVGNIDDAIVEITTETVTQEIDDVEATATVDLSSAGIANLLSESELAIPLLPMDEAQSVDNDAFVKIGFHTGIASSRNGLSDWMSALDEAGIPVVIVAVDNPSALLEAQELAKSSGTEHVLIYQTRGTNWMETTIPNFDLPPQDAAFLHWTQHKKAFPTDLDPSLVWIQTINEPGEFAYIDSDQEWTSSEGLSRAEWLAEFALSTAELVIADGYKWAAFAWNTGEPSIGFWQQPTAREFLKLAAAHPDQLAIAFHEYSGISNDIRREFPNTIGGFQHLFLVVDDFGIPRPTVLITEWGWERFVVPEPEQAVKDIAWAASMYARFPEVKGAAMWTLCCTGSYQDIAIDAQKLIQPLQELTTSHYFDISSSINDPLDVSYSEP